MKFLPFVIASLSPLVAQAEHRDEFVKEKAPSVKQVNEFKRKAGVKKDFPLNLQEIGPDNTVVLSDGSSVSLDGLVPLSVFSSTAKCYEDDKEVECKPPKVFTKTEYGTTVIVSKNVDGEIVSAKIKKASGWAEHLQVVEPGFLANIPKEAMDDEFMNHYTAKHKNGKSHGHRQLRGNTIDHDHDRKLQGPCTSFREVEMAVAVESSFCSEVGALNIDAKVQSIIADVASDYQQQGLCFTAVMTHYEKHCTPSTDPYRTGVALNKSGCDGYGLLDAFKDYWNANRGNVQRDVAHLFSGTGLECDSNGSCTIGCAIEGGACTSDEGYGVNYVSYSSNVALQALLVSHEMGHNLGADHNDASTDYIMHSDESSVTQYFSAVSINKFLSSNSCVTTGGVPPPTTTPPTTASSGSVLQSDAPVTGLAGAEGSIKSWTMTMPSNAVSVTCAISGGTGDADLYTRWDQVVNIDSRDDNACVPWEEDSNEVCSAADLAPIGSVLNVAIHGYEAYSGVSLECSIATTAGATTTTIAPPTTTMTTSTTTSTTSTTTVAPPTTTIPVTTTTTQATPSIIADATALPGNAQWLTGISGSEYEILEYFLIIPGGTTSVRIELEGGTGDADLYATFDKLPDVSSDDLCASENENNFEDCPASVMKPIGQVVYVTVFGYLDFSGARLRVTAN